MSETNQAAPAAAAPESLGAENIESMDSQVEGSDSGLEGQGASKQAEAPDTAGAVKKAAQDASKRGKRKFELKVDGNTEQMEVDLDNEDELRKHLQLSKASMKRMQESAELRKGVNELIEMLRTNPLQVLADPRLEIPDEVRQKLAQSIINNEIEEMGKTPEQKEKERIQREYEHLKKEVEKERSAREEAQQKQLEQKYASDLDTEISQGIEEAKLPKNARTIRYMAEALSFCLQNNVQMTAKELAPYVRKHALSEFKELIGTLPDDEFEDWVGKDRLTNMRKKRVAAAAKVENPNNIKQVSTPKIEQPKKISTSDFFKNLGKF